MRIHRPDFYRYRYCIYYLEYYLADDDGVMLRGYLHGHDDGGAVGHVVAHVVHEEEGGLFHPAPLPLAALLHKYKLFNRSRDPTGY